MMEDFVLRARLRAPIIQIGHLTLDALLMAVLARGDVSDLLRCEDELYHASAGFLRDQIADGKAAFVASMRPEHTPGWADVIKPNTRQGDVQIGLTRQREAGNIINAYTARVANSIEWYATGRMREVHAVVEQIPFIGKRRSAGYGEVITWEVEAGGPGGLVGWVSEPLRPIPTDRWTHGGDWIPVEAAWKAPYWDVRNRTRCFLPEGSL